jgi:hypothetical protein
VESNLLRLEPGTYLTAEDIIVGSLIGFIAAWLIFRIYFPDPFTASAEAAGEPRTVYGTERQRDGFMELNQLPEERGLGHESRDSEV